MRRLSMRLFVVASRRCRGRPRGLRLALRLLLAGRPREGGGDEGLPRRRPAALAPGQLARPRLRLPRHRRPATRDRARRARRHAARRPRGDGGRRARTAPARLRRRERLCNHALHGTGLAGNTASPVHRLDPRAKVIGLLGLTVVAVTTPLSAWPVYVACAVVLAAVAAFAGVGPRTLWRRAQFLIPLVLFVAVFLPFVRGGEQVELGPLSVSREGSPPLPPSRSRPRSAPSSAILLGATTTFPSTLRALEALRVPRLFVLIAGFVYRYLFVVVDEVQRMRAALAARGYRPRSALHAAAVGRVATALFLRTHARGERVYLAMLSRGYDGSDARPRRRSASAPPTSSSCAAVAVAPAADTHARGTRMSCALHARDLRYRYPDGARRCGARPQASATASASPSSAPTAPARRRFVFHLNALLQGSGQLEVAGITVGGKTVRELRARVGLVFQDPDDQLFMPTVREDVAFGPLNQGLDARRGAGTRRRSARRRPHEPRRRPRPASALDGRAPACRDRDRPRDAARAARPRRADRQPRPTRPPRAPHRARPASSARCSSSPTTCPFAAELCERAVILSRRPRSSPTAPARPSSPTSDCSPRTTSSCPPASTRAVSTDATENPRRRDSPDPQLQTEAALASATRSGGARRA